MSDMKNIFASAKNNLIHNDDHYVRFEFVKKYLTPVQLLQMGIDDYAEMLKSAQQSVQLKSAAANANRRVSNETNS